MTYNVFGGTLNPAQPNPTQCQCQCHCCLKRERSQTWWR